MKIATSLFGTLQHWTRFKKTVNPIDTEGPTATPNFATSQVGGSSTVTFSDTFTRSDGDPGSNFSILLGKPSLPEIHSNALRSAISNGSNSTAMYYNGTTFSANQSVFANGVSNSAAFGIVALVGRIQAVSGGSSVPGAPDCYLADIWPVTGQVRLIRYDAGVEHVLWTGSVTFTNGDNYELRLTGSTIALYQNGSLVHSVTDATYTAGGYGGLILYETSADLLVDGFSVSGTGTGALRVRATWDPATDNVAVVRTGIERRMDAGAWSVLQPNASSPYEDTTIQSGHTYDYRTQAFDAANNPGAYSVISSQTITGSVTADTTPPSKVTGLQLESGSGDVLDTYVSWLPATDAGTGVKDYEVLVAGVVVATILHPRVGSTFTPDDINSATPAGSDTGSAISGGGPELWNIADSFFFNHAQVDGDYDCKMTVLTNVGLQANRYGKIGVMERENTDPASRGIWAHHFPAAGANTDKVERREQPSTPATGSAETSGSLARRFWLYSRHQQKTVKVSSITTPGYEVWTQLEQREMSIAQSRLVGKFASNAAGTYQDFSLAPASRIWCKIVGVAGTTKAVTVRARDNAPTPNTGTASDPLSVTWNSASTGGLTGLHPGPRLGAYMITFPENYYVSQWPMMGRRHWIIVGRNYDSVDWDEAGQTRDTMVLGVKAAALANGIASQEITQYVDLNECRFDGGQTQCQKTVLDANNWWVLDSWPSGAKSVSSFGPAYGLTNMTHASAVDGVTGLYPYAHLATLVYRAFFSGNNSAGQASPENSHAISGLSIQPHNYSSHLNGFYVDNLFFQVRVHGDWNKTGSPTDPSTAAFQGGQADAINKWYALMPSGIHGGNTDNAFNPGDPLYGVGQIGMLESIIGTNNSAEVWWSFAQVMALYKGIIDSRATPPRVMFEHSGVTQTGTDERDATPYAAQRFGLCTAMLDDGYCAPDQFGQGQATNEYGVWFFDEHTGGHYYGYAGQPKATSSGARQTGPRIGTVWMREWDNALFLANPWGVAPQVINPSDLPGGSGAWRRIKGTQDPAVNDGQLVTAPFTLNARNGIVLLRVATFG